MNDRILAGRRRCGTFKFRYLRLRAERARKKSDYLKKFQPKTISATKNCIKKLCFGDVRGGRAPGAPPLESASAMVHVQHNYPVYLLLPTSAISNNTLCAGSNHVDLHEVSRPICSEKETYSYTKCHLLQTIGGTYM